MKRDKNVTIKGTILFWVGIILAIYGLSEKESFSIFVAIVALYIFGRMTGKDEVYEEYEKLHYTVLEEAGRKRREAEKKLWRETEEYVKKWEKENQPHKLHE